MILLNFAVPCLSTSDKIAFQLCHAVFLAYSSPSVTLCSAVERRNRRCVTASLPVDLSDMDGRIYRRTLSLIWFDLQSAIIFS